MTTSTTAVATEKQVAFINSLLAQRVVPSSTLAQAEEAITNKATASQFISLLLDLPRKVGSGRPDFQPSTTTVVSAPAPMRVVAEGFYTVQDGEGHVTYRISKARWADGKLVIGYLAGSDNERSYKDFAFVTPTGFKVFRAHQHRDRIIAGAEFLLTGSINEAREAFMNLAEANAMASNTCLCCLRTLTNPASVVRGLGPICARQYGYNV
jgi:hypothetical protein